MCCFELCKIYKELSLAKEDLANLVDSLPDFPYDLYYRCSEDLKRAMLLVDDKILRISSDNSEVNL